MSTLFNTALSALNANQRALATISNNIANVNTDGYSRQTVDLVARRSNATPAGSLGTGVEVAAIRRQFDEFATRQLRESNSALNEQRTRAEQGQQLETVLFDDGNGINSALSSFFDGLQEIAANPSSLSARQSFLSQAQVLTNRFNDIQQRFNGIQDELVDRIGSSVNDVNKLAAEIFRLNEAIGQSQGSQPSELMDQRDEAILKLSSLVKVSVSDNGNGTVSVFIGSGQSLVLPGQRNTLSTDQQGRIFINGSVEITPSIQGGQIGGYLSVQGGTLDLVQAQLKNLASVIANEFNQAQAQGVGLDGQPGQPLFSFIPADDDNFKKHSFTFSLNLTDPVQVAAGSAGGGIGDNSNVLRMAELEFKGVSGPGTPNLNGKTIGGSLRDLVGIIANEVRDSRQGSDAQQALFNFALARREATSGVNLDEEAANLLKFQQAYQASAQMISIARDTFQTLINAFAR